MLVNEKLVLSAGENITFFPLFKLKPLKEPNHLDSNNNQHDYISMVSKPQRAGPRSE